MNQHPILSILAKEGIRLGISRLESFLEYLNPSVLALPCIHIAGTNGKGSVCRLIESILAQSGYKVGLFTSPHLQNINERVRVGQEDISDENLNRLLEYTQAKAVEWALDNDMPSEAPLTYFEMMTAVSLIAFQESGVDLAIMEVGLGGRLDATNIISPLVTAIVSIDYDHTDVLGDDLASIAAEKAGIIKRGIPIILGNIPLEGFRSIRLIADSKEAPIYSLQEDFSIKTNQEGVFSWQGFGRSYSELQIRMEGDHQRDNSAVALAIIENIQENVPVSEDDIRKGLLKARNPGRLEWVSENLLLDCAHNPAGAARLAQYLGDLDRRGKTMTLLLGASEDKDIRSIAVLLAPQVDRILTSHCSHPRAMSDKDIEKIVGGNIPTYAIGPVEDMRHHVNFDKEIVVVAGSIFLAGAVREIYGE